MANGVETLAAPSAHGRIMRRAAVGAPGLRALWRSRPPGTRIQITDGMLVTALRKR